MRPMGRDVADIDFDDLTSPELTDIQRQILQYTEAKQSQSDAPVVWPRKYATVDWLIKKPGA